MRARPRTSEKTLRSNKNNSRTRMRNRRKRPHTAGRVERRAGAGKKGNGKGKPEALRTALNERPQSGPSAASYARSNLGVPARVLDAAPPESPASVVQEDFSFSSSSGNQALQPRPPRRPVRVGPKERAGGIRRRIISGPDTSVASTGDATVMRKIEGAEGFNSP